MIKPRNPGELAIDLLNRSTCTVQVAAVIADAHGIFCWGWNGVGSGLGIHAEHHAITRANRKRLQLATIYVASRRMRNQKTVNSKPCEDCQKLITKWELTAIYRDELGNWTKL